MIRARKFRQFRRRRWGVQRTTRQKVLITATALATLFLIALVSSSLLGMVVFAYYAKNLPSPDRLAPTSWELSTKIFDRNGVLLYDVYGEENRTLIKLEDLPDYTIAATLATEDAEFYKHRGFDIPGIIRAAYNVIFKRKLQGGSTITQQLIKNALVGKERTLPRKVKELILALQVEQRYSKDEILGMYLNNVPYGGQAWGIEAAANMYFGKSAKDLTLAESALLAGLPQKPTAYSPFGAHPENAQQRQSYILHLMQTRGWLNRDGQHEFLSKGEAESAKAEELVYAPFGANIKAPHFVMYVKEILTDRYGAKLVEQGGLQVTTTLDYEKHEMAQRILREEVDKLTRSKVGNSALIAMDPKTGEILAMVGSRDYFDLENDGNVNVTLSERQPGSAIKPINYATAFKKGYTASTLVMDVRTEFPGGIGQPLYIPENYDLIHHGPTQFRYALANSRNLPAVKVLALNGVQAMIDTAHQMGITTLNEPSRYGLSLTLGGGEVKLIDMATAFSVFAVGGYRHDPVAILRVTDADGKVLEEFHPSEGQKVLSEEICFLLSDILSDNEARTPGFGARSWLNVSGRTVAVKTGTTSDFRDAWTIGYTPSLVVGVWAGNNDNSPMIQVPGAMAAAPTWHKVLRDWLKGTPDEPFLKPEGIVEMNVCALSGAPAHEGVASRKEYFIRGTEPWGECQVHKRLEICKADGKLASEACKKAGQAEEREFLIFKALKPEWQSFVDAWVEAQEDERYHPPTEESTTYFTGGGEPSEAQEPLVEIVGLADGDEVGLEFSVEAEVTTPFTVTKVEFYIDDAPIGDPLTSIPYKRNFKLSETMVGEHKIGVKATDSGGNEGSASVTITVVE